MPSVRQFTDAVEGISGASLKSTQEIVSLSSALHVVKGAFAGVVAAARPLLSVMDYAGRVDDLATITGATAGQVVILGRALQNSGRSAADISPLFAKVSQALVAAKTGAASAVEALHRIGLTAGELEGLSGYQQIEALTRGFASIASPAERAAAAMKLFGRSGAEFIPLLTGGDELGRAAQEVGGLAVAMDKNAGVFKRVGEDLSLFGDRMKEAWAKVLEQALPVFDALASAIRNVPTGVLVTGIKLVGVAAAASAAIAISKAGQMVKAWLGVSASIDTATKSLAAHTAAGNAAAAANLRAAAANRGSAWSALPTAQITQPAAPAAIGRFGKIGSLLGKAGGFLGKAGVAGLGLSLLGSGVESWGDGGKEGSLRATAGGIGGGALSGAGYGAMIGSIVPGVGTVAGGLVGAAVGGGIAAAKSIGSSVATVRDSTSFADETARIARPEDISSLEDYDRKLRMVNADMRTLFSMRRETGAIGFFTGMDGDIDEKIDKLNKVRVALTNLNAEQRKALVEKNIADHIAQSAKAAAPAVEKLTKALQAWEDSTAKTVAAQQEVVNRKTVELAGKLGLQGDDAGQLRQQVSDRVEGLQSDLQSKDKGTRDGAVKELTKLADSGLLNEAAALAKEQEKLDEQRHQEEQQNAQRGLATLKANAAAEVAALAQANKSKLISDEEYATRRLAIMEKEHAAEAALDTDENREANTARREAERLGLLTQLTPDAARDTLASAAPTRMTDSLTRIGGDTGTKYTDINTQWQTGLVKNTELQTRLISETNKILKERLNLNTPAPAVAG
ncbi:MAG: hypothetical protein LBC18_13645 [Opitutaceae bacterium]|nr:hypothetical protein [Opitutaceae bacterium]